MTGRGGDEPNTLASVQLDDLLLDAVAAGDLPDDSDPALGLLAALRRDVLADPLAPVPGYLDAAVHARPPVPSRRRWPRPRLTQGAVAAGTVAVFVSLGGVAAASVQAMPNSVLYPVRVLLVGPVVPGPLDVVHQLLASAASDLRAGNVAGARSRLAAAQHSLAALTRQSGDTQRALSQLQAAVDAAGPSGPAGSTTASPVAAAAPTGGPSPAASASSPTVIQPGPQVAGQASSQPSPPPPSPSASATASPSASASPTASPTDSATPSPTASAAPAPQPSGQQPHDASPSPSPSPSASPS